MEHPKSLRDHMGRLVFNRRACLEDLPLTDAHSSRETRTHLTKTQFIVQMAVAYTRLFSDTTTDCAMYRAASVFKEFLADEKIEFGVEGYDWNADGAHCIMYEYEGSEPAIPTPSPGTIDRVSVSTRHLTALLSLLPPKPVTIASGTFFYQDPNAAERLNELRSVYDAMLADARNQSDGSVDGHADAAETPTAVKDLSAGRVEPVGAGIEPGPSDSSFPAVKQGEPDWLRRIRAGLSGEGDPVADMSALLEAYDAALAGNAQGAEPVAPTVSVLDDELLIEWPGLAVVISVDDERFGYTVREGNSFRAGVDNKWTAEVAKDIRAALGVKL